MAACLKIVKKCQHVEARLDYGFDWTRELSRLWAADHPYPYGVTVRPAGLTTGFQYFSSGGQSGAIEPAWPTTVGGTVIDGSIEWIAEVLDDSSLVDQIDSDAWTYDPTGLTVEPVAPVVLEGQQMTSAFISDGVSGEEYVVENEVLTTAGREYVARIILTIE